MKVLTKSIDKNLPRNRLYFDDLVSIFNILKKHYEKVIIQTKNYEVSELDQLKGLESEELDKLTFNCSSANGWLTETRVCFHKDYSHINMIVDSTLNRGILAEIEQVVSKRKQRITSVLSSYAFLISFMIISLGFEFWLMNIDASKLIMGLVLVLIIVYYIYWFWLISNSFSIIALYERKERPNFLRRNKDRILVGLVVAVFSSLLTILVTLLLGRL